MICVSVTPTSRKLAKADLLNASRHCDLIELCLDHLMKEPDIGDMIAGIPKPILISCRRPDDGGKWDGSESERQQLLRQAIIAGPAYIELEMDIAPSIPRFGQTKRVISHTSLHRPLGNVDEIIYAAETAHADVVKFTWPTPTLDDSWPLLAAVTKKHNVPVVGIGIGPGGTTFSLLGRKHGSPWVYATLEPGMETYEGQASVFDLDEIYGWRDITPQTRFLGAIGFGPAQAATVKVFNTAFRQLGLNARCLPLEVALLDKLAKRLDTLRINAVLVGPQAARRMLDFAEPADEATAGSRYCDLVLKQSDGWRAYNLLWRSALRALERTLGKQSPEDRPLDRRNVLILGGTPQAETLAWGIHRRQGVVSITSPRDAEVRDLAQRLGLRHVPYASLYDTLADVLVVADPSITLGHQRHQINGSYLRSGLTVLDLCAMPADTDLVQEARQRGCRVVEPAEVHAEQTAAQFKSTTGRDLPADALSGSAVP